MFWTISDVGKNIPKYIIGLYAHAHAHSHMKTHWSFASFFDHRAQLSFRNSRAYTKRIIFHSLMHARIKHTAYIGKSLGEKPTRRMHCVFIYILNIHTCVCFNKIKTYAVVMHQILINQCGRILNTTWQTLMMLRGPNLSLSLYVNY